MHTELEPGFVFFLTVAAVLAACSLAANLNSVRKGRRSRR